MRIKLIFGITATLGLLYSPQVKGQIQPAQNIIGVDVSTFPQEATFNYDSCFSIGTGLGMRSMGLFQNWTAIETAPLTYNMTIMDIANYYYPAHNMPLDLTITPIHTNNLEVPADLKNLAFDHPQLIARFKALLDSVRLHIPNVSLSSLVIGSEHDVYMGSNAQLWAQYKVFYDSVSAHARSLWPGLKIATELTFNGIIAQNSFAQSLNTNSDYIGISYYPLNANFTVKPVSSIPADFASLVALYPSKPLCFYQYGYPSGPLCNSSETLQAQFITQTFSSWDTYASHIRMIDFTWLHDLDSAQVSFYGHYYGLKDSVFLEYLRSLGLRNWQGHGTDKAALAELRCQARKRGYNQLNIPCATGISAPGKEPVWKLYPNPARDRLYLETSFELSDAEIKIYNQNGQVQKVISALNGKNSLLETDDLPGGMYFLSLLAGGRYLGRTFMLHK